MTKLKITGDWKTDRDYAMKVATEEVGRTLTRLEQKVINKRGWAECRKLKSKQRKQKIEEAHSEWEP